MQSSHVPSSVDKDIKDRIQEKLKRLAEKAAKTKEIPDTATPNSSNSTTTSSNSPPSTASSSTTPSDGVQPQKQSPNYSDDKSASPRNSADGKRPIAQPPVQLSRILDPVQYSTRQNGTQRTDKRNNSHDRKRRSSPRKQQRNKKGAPSSSQHRNNQPLPEWRANSHARSTDWRAPSSPSKMEKLTTLEKQLSFALSSCERRPGRGEAMTDSPHAFVDDSPVDDFHQQITDPAKKYSFELDDFQKRAILHIEQQNFVFVAAHTSAGKTAVAEYAVALAALGGTKVFYTSPIKTLSNQKLRDFRKTFDDVGLVTGDVSINEDAQCVIMTTEILRSMLYRGADVIRDVSYVIFDEVQFLNDEERGVVWEESIIMLPPHIGIIMLSATVPNALEFASWVGKTKDRQVAVVSTNKRPVPLEHAFLHPAESPDVLEASLLLEQDGVFRADNFKNAVAAVKGIKTDTKKNQSRRKRKGANQTDDNCSQTTEAADAESHAQDAIDNAGGSNENQISAERQSKPDGPVEKVGKGRNKNKGSTTVASKKAASGEGKGPGRGPNSRRSPWAPLITYLQATKQTPTVVFCFSKKGCEKAVESLESNDLLPNAADKSHVHILFESAIMRLREEDRNLPQVKRVFANLKRGISAHHAGLLPIVKEITEILFSEGFVKVLFATETFAMGVNMPARAVVFSGLRKNDGRRFRSLEAGEYTQMSGRAGRRGIDRVGNVYLFFPPGEHIPDEGRMRYIMTGRPISLKSAFRLTYNMILNVLRVDELRVEEVMKRSFSEAGGDVNHENIGKMLSMAGDTLNEVAPVSRTKIVDDRGTLGEYVSRFSELNKMSSTLSFRELNPIFREALVPGRLIVAEIETGRLALSVLFSVVPRRVNSRKDKDNEGKDNATRMESQLWVACVHNVVDRQAKNHPNSVLFLPTNRKHSSYRNRRMANVVTGEGLIVGLTKIQAAKIVYIFDDLYELDSDQKRQQADAARSYHFSQKSDKLNKWLSYNASYMQSVISKWSSRVGEDSLSEAMSCEWSSSNKGPPRTRSKLNVSKGYRERAVLCRSMITSEPLFEVLGSKSYPGLMGNIEELLVQESIQNKLAKLKTVQETGSQPSLLPEYENRIKVLQKLNYVGSDGLIVQLKGRCGCEVSTTDSLVLTEIVCENVLYSLSPAEVCSLLSSLVCRKKNVTAIHDKDPKKYSEAYCHAKTKMREVVHNVGKVQEDCAIELEFEIADGGNDYEGSMCRWDLAEVVYEWANGEPFCNITDLTEQQEGDIVVCVKRLSELLKDAQSVAKGVGNVELVSVLEEAVVCIRRDVIFNGSLYYEEEL